MIDRSVSITSSRSDHFPKELGLIYSMQDKKGRPDPPSVATPGCRAPLTCQCPCLTALKSGTTPRRLGCATAAPCSRSSLHTSSFPRPAAAVRAARERKALRETATHSLQCFPTWEHVFLLDTEVMGPGNAKFISYKENRLDWYGFSS